MARAIRESHRTVLVLTQNYLDSQWATFERVMLQTLAPMNEQFRLIPLLKEKCDLPEELGIYNYANFTRPDRQHIAWTQLLTALGAPPVAEPAPAPTRADWFLAHPYPLPPHFTGRAAERAMLSEWLAT